MTKHRGDKDAPEQIALVMGTHGPRIWWPGCAPVDNTLEPVVTYVRADLVSEAVNG